MICTEAYRALQACYVMIHQYPWKTNQRSAEMAVPEIVVPRAWISWAWSMASSAVVAFQPSTGRCVEFFFVFLLFFVAVCGEGTIPTTKKTRGGVVLLWEVGA